MKISMNQIVLFQQKEIRRVYFQNERWFVISDIVAVLTDSTNPSDYLKKIRRRDIELNETFKGGTICPPLGIAFEPAGGFQKLQCWNTPGILPALGINLR